MNTANKTNPAHGLTPHFPRLCLLATLMAVGLAGCKADEKHAMPPPEVTVIKATVANVPMTYEFVGQVTGYRDVQVRARVGGILLKRTYVEGRPVKAGAQLFQIDPTPLQVAHDQARASLELEQAKLTRAKQDYDRILPLYKENAVSQKDRDDAVANYESELASVDVAKAKLRDAQINLGYTRVTAPISGITSKETVSEGSLITTSADASLLTTMSQIDPVYVNYSISDNEALKLRTALRSGHLVAPKDDKYQVELMLGDGSHYKRNGRMNFTDSVIDTSTGTIRARAEFANPEAQLMPGQFVRVFMKGAYLKDAILVPQIAVLTTQNGKVVMTVNAQNKAEPRPVEVGQDVGNDFVIEKGLQPGDTVIVEGAMKAPPGTAVVIVQPKPAAAAPTAK